MQQYEKCVGETRVHYREVGGNLVCKTNAHNLVPYIEELHGMVLLCGRCKGIIQRIEAWERRKTQIGGVR